MTRPIAGPSQTTRTRTPYVLPIGHLSTKSSVYSPVSMSRMSQDLVYNHMKSHYQRISSAKACVDSSAPKSLKLTIKEKDRRRKEALLASSIQRTTPRPRSSSRQTFNTETLNSPKELEINNNSTLSHSPINATETSSLGQRRSERPNSSKSSRRGKNFENFRENGDLQQPHYNQKLNDANDFRLNDDSIRHNVHTDEHNYERYQRTRSRTDKNHNPKMGDSSRKQNNEEMKTFEPNSTNTNNFRVNDSMRHNYEHYQRTRSKIDQKPTTDNSSRKQNNENISEPNITEPSDLYTSSPREEWSDLRNETLENGLGDNDYRTSDRLYTSTPRFERQEEFEVNPGLSTMTFSYKSPPTRRKPRKKNAEEQIWTEEQRYLQFISDVTSDVLARGICSNRVINKVFESHIEKRKSDLDEDNMREMINQLKEDLGVTDD